MKKGSAFVPGTILHSMKYVFAGCMLSFFPVFVFSQDTSVNVSQKVVTLTEVVVRNNLNVAGFITRVQKDTSFYKAFKNLRILGFTALNDIRMLDRKNRVKATLQSRTSQSRSQGCRTMQVQEEKVSGDIYDDKGQWNYYTAELYASLFFTKGKVCGETNIVRRNPQATATSGIKKHKDQLKQLFFNPGSRIPGIPFIGNKTEIFEDHMSGYYDFSIDMEDFKGENCYVFKVSAREDLSSMERSRIVINNMVTWFNSKSMDIVARNYDLSFDAGVYDFDVSMEVQIGRFGDYLVPTLIRYNGNWHALFKKREKGIFTATLFGFTL
jgi:hypothetical protein